MNNPKTSSSFQPVESAGFQISDQPVVRSSGAPAAGNGARSRGTSEADLFYVIARDAKSLFVYWDLNWKRVFAEAGLAPGQVHLRIYRADGAVEDTREINPFRGHCYADVSTAGAGYYCELGCLAGDEWQSLVRSGKTATPDDQMSEDFTAQFATLPLHLSFQRMLNVLRETEDATLASSVAELQGESAATGSANGSAHSAKGTAASDLRVLQQSAGPERPPTSEEIARWKKLGEEFAGTRWGGASAGGFGGSSPA